MWKCDPAADDYHEDSLPGVIIGAEGGMSILEYISSGGAAPTSPPEGVLRRMRRQEHMRAVETHYGPTRIIGSTGHAIGGTAQLPENGPCRRRRRHPRESQESAVGRSGPTRQSDARDSELLAFSRRGTCRVTIIACWEHHFFSANRGRFGAWFDFSAIVMKIFLQKIPLREPCD